MIAVSLAVLQQSEGIIHLIQIRRVLFPQGQSGHILHIGNDLVLPGRIRRQRFGAVRRVKRTASRNQCHTQHKHPSHSQPDQSGCFIFGRLCV